MRAVANTEYWLSGGRWGQGGTGRKRNALALFLGQFMQGVFINHSTLQREESADQPPQA